METLRELTIKLNQAISRCGNFHPLEGVLTLCMDAFHPTIRSAVARCKESLRLATYLNAVDYVQLEGITVRTRTLTSQAVRIVKP